MHEYLVFRLYGMMASFGDIAVGEYRPTYDHPSRSAVFGLLAAALGIRRDEEERLAALAASYEMAVRVDAPGELLRDYHTAQVPPAGKGRKKFSFATRREELAMPREALSTILSTRDYRCDAVYSVCLRAKGRQPPYSLEELKEALNKPYFSLYLGRKSCPLGIPVHAQVVSAETIAGAFQSAQFPDDGLLNELVRPGDVRVFWEGDEDAGIEAEHTVLRYDDPISRKRWQFRSRLEKYGRIQTSGGT
ncbi:crispr-associated protein, cas5e family [hydrocarbon metagenome]|uniref:Crispr-associated protein, cas5e family n=1 Tax=hydrocarbon metagenome TaxID=938273 RepID=A0A0W8FDT8_9ZZZZ